MTSICATDVVDIDKEAVNPNSLNANSNSLLQSTNDEDESISNSSDHESTSNSSDNESEDEQNTTNTTSEKKMKKETQSVENQIHSNVNIDANQAVRNMNFDLDTIKKFNFNSQNLLTLFPDIDELTVDILLKAIYPYSEYKIRCDGNFIPISDFSLEDYEQPEEMKVLFEETISHNFEEFSDNILRFQIYLFQENLSDYLTDKFSIFIDESKFSNIEAFESMLKQLERRDENDDYIKNFKNAFKYANCYSIAFSKNLFSTILNLDEKIMQMTHIKKNLFHKLNLIHFSFQNLINWNLYKFQKRNNTFFTYISMVFDFFFSENTQCKKELEILKRNIILKANIISSRCKNYGIKNNTLFTDFLFKLSDKIMFTTLMMIDENKQNETQYQISSINIASAKLAEFEILFCDFVDNCTSAEKQLIDLEDCNHEFRQLIDNFLNDESLKKFMPCDNTTTINS